MSPHVSTTIPRWTIISAAEPIVSENARALAKRAGHQPIASGASAHCQCGLGYCVALLCMASRLLRLPARDPGFASARQGGSLIRVHPLTAPTTHHFNAATHVATGKSG